MNKVQDFILSILPPETKQRNNGWRFFNCPCCYHTEQSDQKKRGNILFEDENIIYQCFNCKYKWFWKPGYGMSKSMYNFFKDLNLTENDFNNLRQLIQEYIDTEITTTNQPIIKKRELRQIPTNYKMIQESLYKGEKSSTLTKIVNYLYQRNPRLMSWSPLYWAENQQNFLIPCKEYYDIVGYSLRNINDNTNSKYIHFIPQGYVYNYDNFLKDRKYEILVEGQTCALAINGIAYLSSTITPDRLKRILPFTDNKEIIICPDRDKAGMKIIDQIIDENLPFSVSFPNWEKGIKDPEEAVKKYGRLYTIYSILTSKESDKNLIKFKSMKWFSTIL